MAGLGVQRHPSPAAGPGAAPCPVLVAVLGPKGSSSALPLAGAFVPTVPQKGLTQTIVGRKQKPPKPLHPSWQEVVCVWAGATALNSAPRLPRPAAASVGFGRGLGFLLRKSPAAGLSWPVSGSRHSGCLCAQVRGQSRCWAARAAPAAPSAPAPRALRLSRGAALLGCRGAERGPHRTLLPLGGAGAAPGVCLNFLQPLLTVLFLPVRDPAAQALGWMRVLGLHPFPKHWARRWSSSLPGL